MRTKLPTRFAFKFTALALRKHEISLTIEERFGEAGALFSRLIVNKSFDPFTTTNAMI